MEFKKNVQGFVETGFDFLYESTASDETLQIKGPIPYEIIIEVSQIEKRKIYFFKKLNIF